MTEKSNIVKRLQLLIIKEEGGLLSEGKRAKKEKERKGNNQEL